jgi:hypothetical protein
VERPAAAAPEASAAASIFALPLVLQQLAGNGLGENAALKALLNRSPATPSKICRAIVALACSAQRQSRLRLGATRGVSINCDLRRSHSLGLQAEFVSLPTFVRCGGASASPCSHSLTSYTSVSTTISSVVSSSGSLIPFTCMNSRSIWARVRALSPTKSSGSSFMKAAKAPSEIP